MGPKEVCLPERLRPSSLFENCSQKLRAFSSQALWYCPWCHRFLLLTAAVHLQCGLTWYHRPLLCAMRSLAVVFFGVAVCYWK